MKKKIRWFVVGFFACIISIWTVMLASDYSKLKNNKSPLFCMDIIIYDTIDPNISIKRYKGFLYNIDEVKIYEENGCIVCEDTFYTITFFNRNISKVFNKSKDRFDKKYYSE